MFVYLSGFRIYQSVNAEICNMTSTRMILLYFVFFEHSAAIFILTKMQIKRYVTCFCYYMYVICFVVICNVLLSIMWHGLSLRNVLLSLCDVLCLYVMYFLSFCDVFITTWCTFVIMWYALSLCNELLSWCNVLFSIFDAFVTMWCAFVIMCYVMCFCHYIFCRYICDMLLLSCEVFLSLHVCNVILPLCDVLLSSHHDKSLWWHVP